MINSLCRKFNLRKGDEIQEFPRKKREHFFRHRLIKVSSSEGSGKGELLCTERSFFRSLGLFMIRLFPFPE